MDGQVVARVAANGGVIGAGELAHLRCSSDDVQRWVRRGELVRVRRGAYVDPAQWARAGVDERYRLTVLAVARSRGGAEVVSRHSALALWRLPLWDVDRGLVVLSSDVQEAATRAGLRVTPVRGLVAVRRINGLRVQTVADAVVTTSSFSMEGGVVAADAALRAGSCTLDDLEDARERLLSSLRGRARVRKALDSVDGSSESPGESRTRLLLVALGLPVEPQFEVLDGWGRVMARVDFLVAGRVVVEFDGAVKYAGADGQAALVAEKLREDRLREMGFVVIRLTWADLARPHEVRRRIEAALRRAAA
ncbi:type IV toxin-antitoxin system AbiEi family antitoxin domain-containing protein [Pedococcus sp. KACC 23699]|uniref:Type IV toxin-antitoxin system AbiEi family antitoxin domain-containing protein n=1 Tax=Pedococcus sp. KACC 23699 TaxID=3149228 RepID=A0AAU7JXF1_9MICO